MRSRDQTDWWWLVHWLQASVFSSSSSLHKNRNKINNSSADAASMATSVQWKQWILWKFRGHLYRRLVTSLKLWDDSWFVGNLIEESLSQNFRNILLQSLDSKTQCICFRDQNSYSLKQVLLCNLVTVMEALRYRVNMDPSITCFESCQGLNQMCWTRSWANNSFITKISSSEKLYQGYPCFYLASLGLKSHNELMQKPKETLLRGKQKHYLRSKGKGKSTPDKKKL